MILITWFAIKKVSSYSYFSSSTTSGDCTHLRVCLSIFYHTRHPWMVFWTCTVTCRQFSNLTFAPRKTCHLCGSNLALHCYQCHNNWEYTRPLRKMQVFFSLFLIFFLYLIPYNFLLNLGLYVETKKNQLVGTLERVWKRLSARCASQFVGYFARMRAP